jgi:hypothetical protein
MQYGFSGISPTMVPPFNGGLFNRIGNDTEHTDEINTSWTGIQAQGNNQSVNNPLLFPPS